MICENPFFLPGQCRFHKESCPQSPHDRAQLHVIQQTHPNCATWNLVFLSICSGTDASLGLRSMKRYSGAQIPWVEEHKSTWNYHCISFFVQIAQTQALTTQCRQADWCLVRQRAGYREPTTALFPAKDPGWRFDHCSYKRFLLLLWRLSTYLRGKRRTWLTWLISSFWHTRKVD